MICRPLICRSQQQEHSAGPCGIKVLTNIKKEGEAVVELDQFKSILATYTEPLVEVRDSL